MRIYQHLAVVFLVPIALIRIAAADTPILGGTAVPLGEYPAVVAVQISANLCTGTLISPEWVLTAGHCLTPSVVGLSTQAQVTAAVMVHFNTISVFQQPGTIVTASATFVDPMFNADVEGMYDAGLIKLASPVTTVTPVQVNLAAANAPVGLAVTTVGYGTTALHNGTVGIEYAVGQTSIACTATDGSDATDANLLCFDQTNNTGQCNGDSGGPALAMINGNLVQVGITSFGDNDCDQYGADTRTDIESSFIEQYVLDLECSADTDCPATRECFLHACIAMPFSPTGLGSTCTTDTDCDSGSCADGPGGKKCSLTCTPGAMDVCPTGLDCLSAAGGEGACWPASQSGGCSAAGGSAAPALLAGIGVCLLVMRRRNRRDNAQT